MPLVGGSTNQVFGCYLQSACNVGEYSKNFKHPLTMAGLSRIACAILIITTKPPVKPIKIFHTFITTSKTTTCPCGFRIYAATPPTPSRGERDINTSYRNARQVLWAISYTSIMRLNTPAGFFTKFIQTDFFEYSPPEFPDRNSSQYCLIWMPAAFSGFIMNPSNLEIPNDT